MQLSRVLKMIAVVVSIAFASAAANATIITFDSLEVPGNSVSQFPTYTESGFIFTSSECPSGSGCALAFSSGWQNNTEFYAGSAGLFNNNNSATTTLRKGGGGSFSVSSIDLARLKNSNASASDVTFIGTLDVGGTVSQTFGGLATSPGTFAFTSFSFTGFTNIVSMSWDQTQANNGHQFDNVNVTGSVSVPVPEPTTLLLLGVGLAGLGFARKRVH
jgi:hypothetical protein